MSSEAIVSDADKERVIERIRHAQSSWTTYAPRLDWFRGGLDDVKTVPPAEVPDDVITMNSRFRDVKRATSEVYTLVYPDEAALRDGKLSALTPVGTALLGSRAGDVVRVATANGIRRIAVEAILYQPESAGRSEPEELYSEERLETRNDGAATPDVESVRCRVLAREQNHAGAQHA